MSRSYKKIAAGGNSLCPSEKRDKKLFHKRYRRMLAQTVHRYLRNDDYEPPYVDKNEAAEIWCFGKDGKSVYFKSYGCIREEFILFPARFLFGRYLTVREKYGIISK